MGRILAVDPGTVRVGLAVSDPLRISAHPLEVVESSAALDRITELCAALEVEEVIVGLPATESGREGEGAARARSLAESIERRTGLPVTPVDEKYTTRLAESLMVGAGVRRRRRRESIDKVAAAVLLRGYLDAHPAEGPE